MSPETEGYSEDNILIIKGRFKSNSMNLFGLIILFFTQNNQIDSFNIVVTTYSSIYDIEPHAEWDKFEEMITEMKWKGTFNTSMTNSLMDQFKNLSEEQHTIDLLYDNTYNYDYDNLDITLFDLINRIVHDKNLILETNIQETTPQEFKETKENRGKTETSDEETEDQTPAASNDLIEEGSVILPIKAIVAPVRGRPIYDLKIGDKIMVRIQDTSERAKYFIDLLKLKDETQRDENKVKPIPAEVIDLKSGSGKNNPSEILTEIGPGLYGKIIEDEKQIKLKLYNPGIDDPIKGTNIKSQLKAALGNDNKQDKSDFSKGAVIMLSLFLLILSLFIFLIFLSW